jgi:hypothetical protein
MCRRKLSQVRNLSVARKWKTHRHGGFAADSNCGETVTMASEQASLISGIPHSVAIRAGVGVPHYKTGRKLHSKPLQKTEMWSID